MLSYKKHIRETFLLAYPVCLGQLGHVMVGVADSLMVGNYGGENSEIGTLSLAAASLANALIHIILVLGIGISYGATPLIAAADSKNETKEIADLLRNSILLCLITGFIISISLYFSSPLLKHFNQPENVVELAIPYFNIMVFSMFPLMIFLACKQFAEGLSDTKTAMYISIGANLLNVFLNYLFIYGNWGFKEMGLNGAGWASFIARVVMALSMGWYVYKASKFKAYHDGFKLLNFEWKKVGEIFKVGLPVGLQFTFEVSAFAIAAVMIGWISAEDLAAHQIALSLASLTYMFASGLSAAASVRVGNFYGVKNYSDLRKAGNTALIMVLAFMGTMALLFVAFNNFLPTLFNKNENVLLIASNLLLIAALFQLSDGSQVVGQGLLRGMADVKVPTIFAFVAYWIIGLPVGWLLGFKFNLGSSGIWYGLSMGLTAATILNFIRFYHKTNIHQKL
ncbi:MAG: MATE family efflux transporter [Bacteroidia bacterium]